MSEDPQSNKNWQTFIFKNHNNVSESPFGKQPEKDIDSIAATLKQKEENEKTIIEQFVENEKQNRTFKPKVFRAVCCFAVFQLLVMAIIILIIIIGLVVGDSNFWFIHKIDNAICKDLFDFLKYYISATIVELLGMLYFIVKQVFGNNVAKMFETNQKNYDRQNKKKKKQKNDKYE